MLAYEKSMTAYGVRQELGDRRSTEVVWVGLVSRLPCQAKLGMRLCLAPSGEEGVVNPVPCVCSVSQAEG